MKHTPIINVAKTEADLAAAMSQLAKLKALKDELDAMIAAGIVDPAAFDKLAADIRSIEATAQVSIERIDAILSHLNSSDDA